jgi:hypothetical protein
MFDSGGLDVSVLASAAPGAELEAGAGVGSELDLGNGPDLDDPVALDDPGDLDGPVDLDDPGDGGECVETGDDRLVVKVELVADLETWLGLAGGAVKFSV